MDYALAQGARIIEGYPVEPGARLYTYMGSPATFRQAGFHEMATMTGGRLIMRYIRDTLEG